MHQLKTGLTSSTSYTATEERLADRYGNPGIPVLATPHLVHLAEAECVRCVLPFLAPGEATVGIRLDVRHLAATPAGMPFTMRATLKEIDRRRLVFDVEAHDAVDLCFAGSHERFIIESKPFLAKAMEKGKRA
ncbi:MAG TPA: thioesterase family protein [Candidatus Eremiobacteraceae bacterium]|nr:thioesterase family protein [Candidatus Eremiobacteraceae bacterium]